MTKCPATGQQWGETKHIGDSLIVLLLAQSVYFLPQAVGKIHKYQNFVWSICTYVPDCNSAIIHWDGIWLQYSDGRAAPNLNWKSSPLIESSHFPFAAPRYFNHVETSKNAVGGYKVEVVSLETYWQCKGSGPIKQLCFGILGYVLHKNCLKIWKLSPKTEAWVFKPLLKMKIEIPTFPDFAILWTKCSHHDPGKRGTLSRWQIWTMCNSAYQSYLTFVTICMLSV